MLNIYSNIERLREERKIPKVAFYSKIKMSSTGYLKMVDGDSMKMSTLRKICEVLEVDPAYLFIDTQVGHGTLVAGTVAINTDPQLQKCIEERNHLKDTIMTLQSQLIDQMKEAKTTRAKQLK